MYIPPFTCGVIATILVEVGIAVLYGIIKNIKEDTKNGKDSEVREQGKNNKH